MQEFLQDRFFIGAGVGLAVGLALAFLSWFSAWRQRRQLRAETNARLAAVQAELDRLRQHLQTQLDITAKGNEEQRRQGEELRAQNENLRVAVQALQQKPDRAALRSLEVWQRALDALHARAPGFGPAWQQALREAEQEVQEMDAGLRGWVRRFLGTGRGPNALPPGEPGATTTDPTANPPA